MKCITCKTQMKCVSDVSDIYVRIDFVECPKCGSKADIIYGNNGEYVDQVNWRR